MAGFFSDHARVNVLPLGLGIALLISVAAAFIIIPTATIYGFFAGISRWKCMKRASISQTRELLASIAKMPDEELKKIIEFFATRLEDCCDPDRRVFNSDAIYVRVELLRQVAPAVQTLAP